MNWQFKTAIKVDVVNETESSNKDDYIQYGSEDYQYPLLVDMLDVVSKVKSNRTITVKPINDPKFSYLIENRNLCHGYDKKLDLLLLIKSSPENIKSRDVIRSTWARWNCWGGRLVKHLFLFGSLPKGKEDKMKQIQQEQLSYKDVLQADFIDHYYNNTLKLMMGLQWAVDNCNNNLGSARIISFVDDDYLVQPRTVLQYIDSVSESLLPRLFSGYVWRAAMPQRNKAKKWFVSHNDYPWSVYPPYCSAGHFFVSMELANDISIAMKYTKFLRFDDVFLGLVLHKLLVVPIHVSAIYSFSPAKSVTPGYKQLISSHGYKSTTELLKAWINLKGADYCVDSHNSPTPINGSVDSGNTNDDGHILDNLLVDINRNTNSSTLSASQPSSTDQQYIDSPVLDSSSNYKYV